MTEFFKQHEGVYTLAHGIVLLMLVVNLALIKWKRRGKVRIYFTAFLAWSYATLFLYVAAWNYLAPGKDFRNMHGHLLMMFVLWLIWGREIELYILRNPPQQDKAL